MTAGRHRLKESWGSLEWLAGFYLGIWVSSKQDSAEYFLWASRDHWHIENKLHWVLDVAFREDESRLRKGDGAENFSVLRRIALNLLKKEETEKTELKRRDYEQAGMKNIL